MFQNSDRYSNQKNTCRRSAAAGKKRAGSCALFCALFTALSLFAFSACNIIPADLINVPTHIDRATLSPSAPAAETQEPQHTAPEEITRGPEPLVSPIPDTPCDPLSPENYPMPEQFKTELTVLLDRAGGGNIYRKIYSIMNNGSPGTPFFYYDYGDMITEFPGYLELAQYMLQNGHGVCYHYASLTCYLLRAAGYEACVIHGYRAVDEALHYWTMVKTDQGWYHFDPLHHQMLMTDAEKQSDDATSGNGITWQAGVWPETPKTDYIE